MGGTWVCVEQNKGTTQNLGGLPQVPFAAGDPLFRG